MNQTDIAQHAGLLRDDLMEAIAKTAVQHDDRVPEDIRSEVFRMAMILVVWHLSKPHIEDFIEELREADSALSEGGSLQ